ncbi:MAG: radical SAM protein [Sandaracinaceae bacterium]
MSARAELRRGLRVVGGAARFAGAALGGPRALLGVGWSITMRCNARCPFCSRHSGPDGLPTATGLRLIDELGEMGCLRLHFTGGEPLVRKDLPELLDRAGERGLRRTINTNGILLARRPEVIARTDAFVVSVDGSPEVHDGYRGPGAFAHMVEGVEALAAANKRFAFSFALFEKSLDHVDFLIDLARRYDTFLIVQPGAMHVIGSSEPNPERPELARYREIIRRMREDPRWRPWVWNSTPALEHLEGFPEGAPMRCHAGRITCRMEVDGRLYPCSRTVLDPRAEDAPNAAELGMREAFARLRPIDCEGAQCWAAHNIEKNLVFALDPRACWNLATRNYASRARRA